MKCVFCGNNNTRAFDTRQYVAGHTFRRRKCMNCGKTFRTNEVAVPDEIKDDVKMAKAYCMSWAQKNGIIKRKYNKAVDKS